MSALPGKPPKVRIDFSVLVRTLTFSGSVLFLTFLGFQLDQKLHTNIWALVGAAAGVLYCFFEAWRMVRNSRSKGPIK